MVVYIVTDAGCHECISHSTDDSGYPIIKHHGKCRRIAKVLFDQKIGKLLPGMVLRHTCDNRKCINVAHLVPGTHRQNVADRVSRGRSAIGERNGRAKLSECNVLEILRSTESSRDLGERFGVDPKVIRNIRDGKSWRHVKRSCA